MRLDLGWVRVPNQAPVNATQGHGVSDQQKLPISHAQHALHFAIRFFLSFVQ